MEALVEEGPLVEEEPLGAFRIIKKADSPRFFYLLLIQFPLKNLQELID